jgi:hypothetical protein
MGRSKAITLFEEAEALTMDDWLLYLAHLLKGRTQSAFVETPRPRHRSNEQSPFVQTREARNSRWRRFCTHAAPQLQMF